MALRGSQLFRDGAILVLLSKYAWYRRQGYTHAEASTKARWRAGLLPAEGPSTGPDVSYRVLRPNSLRPSQSR